jgi:nitronate monooxygenase
LTSRISGTPASVIRTPYIDKIGLALPWHLRVLKKNKLAKKYIVPFIHYLGIKKLERGATEPTWKTVWSAGQSVGMIDEILSCREIMEKLIHEYEYAVTHLPPLGR